MSDTDTPQGAAVIQTMTLPAQGNLHGGVFGGWILMQFDLAAGMAGHRFAGPCLTRTVKEVNFLSPLKVGEEFAIHAEVTAKGRSSFTLALTGWADPVTAPRRVVTAEFVMVAIDENGRSRPF